MKRGDVSVGGEPALGEERERDGVELGVVGKREEESIADAPSGGGGLEAFQAGLLVG